MTFKYWVWWLWQLNTCKHLHQFDNTWETLSKNVALSLWEWEWSTDSTPGLVFNVWPHGTYAELYIRPAGRLFQFDVWRLIFCEQSESTVYKGCLCSCPLQEKRAQRCSVAFLTLLLLLHNASVYDFHLTSPQLKKHFSQPVISFKNSTGRILCHAFICLWMQMFAINLYDLILLVSLLKR